MRYCAVSPHKDISIYQGILKMDYYAFTKNVKQKKTFGLRRPSLFLKQVIYAGA